MTMDRVEPARLGDERAQLDAWLDYYRASVPFKCSGLTAEQLVARSCPPSDMSLAGLVRHLTEMERAYSLRLEDPGAAPLYCTDEDPDGDFGSASAADAVADLEIFADHCARARAVMARHELDETFGRNSLRSLRWTYLYLIKEYARHLGHADLLRERIDGVAGE